MLEKTPDYLANHNRPIGSTKNPDFKLKSKLTGGEFWVEAKYRSYLFNNSFKWFNYYQLKRYRMLNRVTPVYIVIGIGGCPNSPLEVFLVPLKEIHYLDIFRSFLMNYKVEKIEGSSIASLL